MIAATAMDSPASIHGVYIALREFCPNCEMKWLETLMGGHKAKFAELLHYLQHVGVIEEKAHVVLRGSAGKGSDLLLERPGG